MIHNKQASIRRFSRGMDIRSRYLYTAMEQHHYIDQTRKERTHNTGALGSVGQMGTISCMMVGITALETSNATIMSTVVAASLF